MHRPSEVTSQYDPPERTVHLVSGGGGGGGGNGGGDGGLGGHGGGHGGGGDGGGGDGGGGDGDGDGGGDSGVPVQISKPVPVTEPSLDQVTVDPAATCTFIGPVEPE